MTIPLSSKAIEEFTPDSLGNLPQPPVFLMKAITGADLPKLRRSAAVAGLRQVEEQDLRDEIRRCLREGWSDDVYDTEMARLEEFWAKADQKIPIEAAEIEAYAALIDQIDRGYETYRILAADREAFMAQYPFIVLAHVLQGWQHLDAPFARAGGAVADEAMVAMQDSLRALEQAAAAQGIKGVEPGIALLQLVSKGFEMIRLPGSAAKNSASPSPGSSGRNSSAATARRSRTASSSRARTGKARTKAGATSS